MVHICSLAGETLATFSADEVEGKSVKLLKVAFAKQTGVTRFQQRWLSQDHVELRDDAVLPCCDVQLVVLSFTQAEKHEIMHLISACSENHRDEVVDLLRKPLNPDALPERRGFLPALHLAAQKGHSQIVELLLEAGTDVNIAERDDHSYNPNDEDYGYDYLCNGMTALHWAASEGHSTVVELLLEASADKHAADDSGSTALHFAATRGHSEVVKLLLEAGAHKDVVVDDYQVTALQLAAIGGHSNVVKLLLEAGAHKDAANSCGSTALHMAAGAVAGAGFGHPEVVKLLLEAGSDRNVAQNNA